ncbi:MAG TPA: hypothetical protein VFQ76_04060 [Longimicrobiaceae bacterium]|nr:hypothetical protein [Longimicrobiaceae bacterium]
MTRPAGILAAAALLVAAAPLRAQEVVSCAPAETVQGCYARYRPTGGVPAAPGDAAGPAEAAVAGDVARRLQAKPTGNDLSADGPLTAIRDFLPRLGAAVLAPTAGEDPSSLGFKANLPLNDGVLFDWGMTAQLAALVHEAQPFTVLVDAIPLSLRAAARERLQAGLEPYDDLSLTGALNLENRVFGRGMRQHRDAIGAVVRAVLDPGGTGMSPVDDANLLFATEQAQLGAEVLADSQGLLVAASRARQPECMLGKPGGPRDAGEMRADCFTPAGVARIEASIARTAAAAARDLRDAERRVRASGILRLAQLMNNQPQLNGTAEYRVRRDVAGPDEWTGTARFEMGFANMNGLRRHCGAGGVRPACLRSYVEDRAVRGSLARGDRAWAQLDFTGRRRWSVRIPEDSVDVALGAASSVAVSGGYGAYFGNPDDADDRDRLDLQVKYELTRDDPVRQDRFVSTLFYTRRLSDQSSALLGVTFANRPEFLGEVDRNLGAHLGLTYKLDRSPASVAGSR